MKTPKLVSAIERTMRQRLLASHRRCFREPPRRILLGFSGGNDSLALALLLSVVRPVLDTEFILLHVDHRMRAESGDDAIAAETLAVTMGIPIRILHAPDVPRKLFPGVGPEEAARRVRYERFASVSTPGDALVLAHHAGDQAETVLLHLLRGSGTDGLAGMRELSSIRVPWWEHAGEQTEIRVWRPLLGETRADLVRLVATCGLTPIEDPGNADLTYRRNLIRQRLLPELKSIEPTIEERLGTLARIAADEDDLLDTLATDSGAPFEAGPLLSRSAIDYAHPAIARRIVRSWLTVHVGLEPSFDRIEAVRRLSERNDGGAMVQLGGNIVAWIDRTHIHAGLEDACRADKT